MMTVHRRHIELIFRALDSASEADDIKHMGIPDTIDPDKFNRMLIAIDGEQYCVSVFRPAEAPVEAVDE